MINFCEDKGHDATHAQGVRTDVVSGENYGRTWSAYNIADIVGYFVTI